MASTSPSSRTAATAIRRCGCPKAGTGSAPGELAQPLYWRRDGDGAGSEFTLHGLQRARPGAAGHSRVAVTRPMPMRAGRRAPADRSGMGIRRAGRRRRPRAGARCTPSRGGRGRPAAAVRRRAGSGPAAATRLIPAIAPAAGALGEYNGKFMVNQYVLRGSSCATPAGPRARQLPQLLPGRRALAVHRHPAGEVAVEPASRLCVRLSARLPTSSLWRI